MKVKSKDTGIEYDVVKDNGTEYRFAGYSGWWPKSSYSIVQKTTSAQEVKLRVKCVEENGALVVGNIYTAIDRGEVYDGNPYYYIEEFDLDFKQRRFVVVKDENKPLISDNVIDCEEEKFRKLLRPHVGVNECICGIARASCDYHR